MDINYFMKIQNAYGTKSKREKELAKTNREMERHFEDTYDTEEVLINGIPKRLMIIKDTDGNTYKKKIKSCHNDKFNLGDYVIWNNQYWLITLLDPDEKTWNRGYMYLCTVPLRWINADGEIIERFAYSEDFTKYSSGVYNNGTLKIGDNQYGLTVPIDEETKKLKRDMRFAIDFEDAVEPDVYDLSNRKPLLNSDEYFNRGGTMILTMSLGFFNKDTDKRVKLPDGKEVWICDYHSSTVSPDINNPDFSNETANLSAEILGNRNLKIGYPRTYSVKFMNSNGDDVTVSNFDWNIVSNFQIKQTLKLNTIGLSILDDSLIGESFLLQIIINGNVISEAKIVITEGM